MRLVAKVSTAVLLFIKLADFHWLTLDEWKSLFTLDDVMRTWQQSSTTLLEVSSRDIQTFITTTTLKRLPEDLKIF